SLTAHFLPFTSTHSSVLLRFLPNTPNRPNTSLFHLKLWQS
ncbi:hypothetical protein HMPREF9078_01382, partial [Capnocytophaga sp. oral taxon 380 str. F0488]